MIDSPPFAGLTCGVGLLDHETIQQFGVSGPAARASRVVLICASRRLIWPIGS